jgi:TonB family protein
MKCLLTLITVSFLTGLQALAQADSTKAPLDLPGKAGPSATPRRQPRIDLVAARWHLRELNAALAKDPDNRACRLELAQALESLAALFEERRDYLNAWRYYDSAAKVLDHAREKSWKKRADDDAHKAASNRKRGLDYIDKKKDNGWVYTTFDWRDYKSIDRNVCAEYMKQVGLPVLRDWSISKKLYQLSIPAGFSPRLVVSFNVHRDGTMSDIKLAKSCGSKSVDAFALRAVQDAGKVPPLLPAMGDVVPFESQFVK